VLSNGFAGVRVSTEGSLVAHCDEPGYRRVARFAGEASLLIGHYVQVITDDVPAATGPIVPL
jgi:hypothetical protein